MCQAVRSLLEARPAGSVCRTLLRACAAARPRAPRRAEARARGAAAGAGDRLGLRCDVTGDSVPTAMLPYCGRTLLEGLLRDLQARPRPARLRRRLPRSCSVCHASMAAKGPVSERPHQSAWTRAAELESAKRLG